MSKSFIISPLEETFLSRIENHLKTKNIDDPCDEKGNKLIHLAACHPFPTSLKLLIDKGANIHLKSSDGIKPLIHALLAMNSDNVDILLQAGADINEGTNHKNMPVLHVAAKDGFEKVAQFIISKGGNPNIRDIDGHTALHWAVDKGHIPVVSVLIASNFDLVGLKDKTGLTPLSMAAINGNVDVMDLLITTSKKEINEKDNNGRIALHFAANRGHLNVVNLLLKNKSNIDEKDNFGETPLHLSCNQGYKVIVENLILAGANIHEQNNAGMTPLYHATINDMAEIVQVLKDNKVNFDQKLNKTGMTLLHLVSRAGLKFAADLLIKNGVNPNIEDYLGKLPLCYAIQENKPALVKLLLDNGAEIRGLLSIAFLVGNPDIIDMLIAHGEDVNAARNEGGSNLLHAAARQGWADMVKLLLLKGANIDARDNAGLSPLAYSLINDNKDVSRILIEKTLEQNNKEGLKSNIQGNTDFLMVVVENCQKTLELFGKEKVGSSKIVADLLEVAIINILRNSVSDIDTITSELLELTISGSTDLTANEKEPTDDLTS